MLPWKQRKCEILPINQNLSSVYFSLAKFQLVSCNLSLAMINLANDIHCILTIYLYLLNMCSATLMYNNIYVHVHVCCKATLPFRLNFFCHYNSLIFCCLFTGDNAYTLNDRLFAVPIHGPETSCSVCHTKRAFEYETERSYVRWVLMFLSEHFLLLTSGSKSTCTCTWKVW